MTQTQAPQGGSALARRSAQALAEGGLLARQIPAFAAREAQQRLAKLEGASVTIYANASTEGKLYGSVGPREIADALTKAVTPVNKSEVVLGEGAFRNTGEFEVVVHLHADAETTVKLVIEGEVA